jgi:hypothetical protein
VLAGCLDLSGLVPDKLGKSNNVCKKVRLHFQVRTIVLCWYQPGNMFCRLKAGSRPGSSLGQGTSLVAMSPLLLLGGQQPHTCMNMPTRLWKTVKDIGRSPVPRTRTMRLPSYTTETINRTTYRVNNISRYGRINKISC